MTDIEAAQNVVDDGLDEDNDLIELREGAGSVSVILVTQVLTSVAAPFAIGFFIAFTTLQ